MKITPTALPEVLLIEPTIYNDDRGYFFEGHQHKKYHEAGITTTFVQDNVSCSKKNVLRGLHYQLANPQDKLVYPIQGTIYDVIVDVRKDSPNFGKWTSEILSHENHRQLYVPKGFAHGFCVLSETAMIVYKCSDYYDPKSEFGIIWNDPTLNIKWPIDNPILSKKDAVNSQLSQLLEQHLL